MKFTSFLPCFLALLAAAGPAPSGCGEQCFTATDDCGVAYSACWDQCTLSGTQAQVITRPACSTLPTPTLATNTNLNATITDAPSPTGASCKKPWQCIDFLTTCGNSTGMWGTCYDMCRKSKAPSPPACTLAPVTVTAWTGNATTATRTRSSGPRPACTHKKAFMCAPANW